MMVEPSGEGSVGTVAPCTPAGYATVTPIVYLKNASEAIDFYERVFGAREVKRVPGPAGTVAHAEIRMGNSTLVLVDHLPGSDPSREPGSRSPRIELAYYCEDVDALFSRALEAGASVAMPVTNVFWGDRYGKILDPFGQIWALATRREHLSAEQVIERSRGPAPAGPVSGP